MRLYKKNAVDLMRGGMSNLTAQLLGAMDFPMDFVVEAPPASEAPPAPYGRRYELSFDIFLADEKAIKEMLAVKGAGSYKPCCKCMAIVGRILEADVRPPFQHQANTCSWLYSMTSVITVVTHDKLLRAVPWVRDGRHITAILPMYAPDLIN